MNQSAELRRRTWKSDAQSPSLLHMVDAPKNWSIWLHLDIDVDFESYYDETVTEEDDKETVESRIKDRTRPWIVRVCERNGMSIIVGPRHERVRNAMGWAEDFAEDLDIAAGNVQVALGRMSGSA